MSSYFSGLLPPRPAPGLRARVLAAAAAARPVHWIDALWESRHARVALALALLLACALNLRVERGAAPPATAPRVVEIEGFSVDLARFEPEREPLPEEFR